MTTRKRKYIEEDNKMDIESKDENKKSRYISKKTISMILEKYKYKCANNPNNPVIKDYYCPMWLLYNGDFDISRYEIDHIEEYSLTGDNSIDNLQPLCPSCHTVKTKKFLKNKCVFTSSEINHGRCFMEV
jgi:CRISPR/Cas system Type II protein with McrA/HNH and RuvC-like nuclease domain